MTPQPLPSTASSPTSSSNPALSSQLRPHYLIDSHIHLWPASASNSTSHTWMTPPSMPLAREHLLPDYIASASQVVSLPDTISNTTNPSKYSTPTPAANSLKSSQAQPPKPHLLGAIYVETDRTLLPPSPSPENRYTHPLQEIQFLRNLTTTTTTTTSPLILAYIPWAPVDEGAVGMHRYMKLARATAGEETWAKIIGFRFLVQALREQDVFREKVGSQAWMEGLRWLGREGRAWRSGGGGKDKGRGNERGFVFEVGVDQRQGGTWQLDGFAGCVERLRGAEDRDGDGGRTVFVLNHFCKPAFSSASDNSTNSFKAWKAAMTRLSRLSPIYLKLSGFLTELPTSPLSSPPTLALILPYVAAAFELFGARRIMFGSDWPVCGVGARADNFNAAAGVGSCADDGKDGKEGEEEEGGGGEGGGEDEGGTPNPTAYSEWHHIVTLLLNSESLHLSDEDKEWVWWRTSAACYGLDLDMDV